MTAAHWHMVRKIYRRTGIAIGIFLLVMEGFDAVLTPRPDWIWFGLAILLIVVCRSRKDGGETLPQ